MSWSPPEPDLDLRAEAGDAVPTELVDGELIAVEATARELEPRRSAKAVAVQAAAVATTGFVAGAIATAVVAHRSAAARRRPALPRGVEVLDTQRFVVDVHRVRVRAR